MSPRESRGEGERAEGGQTSLSSGLGVGPSARGKAEFSCCYLLFLARVSVATSMDEGRAPIGAKHETVFLR
jgi:hypothetical protein